MYKRYAFACSRNMTFMLMHCFAMALATMTSSYENNNMGGNSYTTPSPTPQPCNLQNGVCLNTQCVTGTRFCGYPPSHCVNDITLLVGYVNRSNDDGWESVNVRGRCDANFTLTMKTDQKQCVLSCIPCHVDNCAFATQNTQSHSALCLDGHYPLYISESAAKAQSPTVSAHVHDVDGVTYYMPDNHALNTHGTADCSTFAAASDSCVCQRCDDGYTLHGDSIQSQTCNAVTACDASCAACDGPRDVDCTRCFENFTLADNHTCVAKHAHDTNSSTVAPTQAPTLMPTQCDPQCKPGSCNATFDCIECIAGYTTDKSASPITCKVDSDDDKANNALIIGSVGLVIAVCAAFAAGFAFRRRKAAQTDASQEEAIRQQKALDKAPPARADGNADVLQYLPIRNGGLAF